jgi:cell division protein FtsZ
MNTEETEIESIISNNPANDYEQSFSEEALNSSHVTEENSSTEVEQSSNGLENFGVEEDAPDLFNLDNESSDSQDLLSTDSEEKSSEDDDLEIPAFLRRQKN